MKDSLNIAKWRKVMIRTALKRFNTKKEAAKALGVSVRTLEKY
jgi:transcriptional regulator with PAS, ATPase and Fis domain